jgi:hypothetical protein
MIVTQRYQYSTRPLTFSGLLHLCRQANSRAEIVYRGGVSPTPLSKCPQNQRHSSQELHTAYLLLMNAAAAEGHPEFLQMW